MEKTKTKKKLGKATGTCLQRKKDEKKGKSASLFLFYL